MVILTFAILGLAAAIDIHASAKQAQAQGGGMRDNDAARAPPAQNLFTTNAGFGAHGGSCTCPDGQVYQVGDNHDSCGSLACIGGTPGTCNSAHGAWSGNKVECALGADYKGSHGAVDNHLDIRAGEREHCIHVKTGTRAPVKDGLSCFESATDKDTCNGKYERKTRGTHRVGEDENGNDYTAQYGLVGEVHLCEWREELSRCEAGPVFTVCPEEPHVVETEVHTNFFHTNVPGVGGYGGSCTCPDGQVYQVGDNLDSCGSLACIGGTPGTCNSQNGGEWSYNKVICGRLP